jgi:hypothetical protein
MNFYSAAGSENSPAALRFSNDWIFFRALSKKSVEVFPLWMYNMICMTKICIHIVIIHRQIEQIEVVKHGNM